MNRYKESINELNEWELRATVVAIGRVKRNAGFAEGME